MTVQGVYRHLAQERERRVTQALKVFAAFAMSASHGAARDVDGTAATLRQAAELESIIYHNHH